MQLHHAYYLIQFYYCTDKMNSLFNSPRPWWQHRMARRVGYITRNTFRNHTYVDITYVAPKSQRQETTTLPMLLISRAIACAPEKPPTTPLYKIKIGLICNSMISPCTITIFLPALLALLIPNTTANHAVT